jgi:hypothetical protein
MLIDRRHFLVGSVLSLAAGPHALAERAAGAEEADFISACRHASGGYALALLTRSGKILREIPLSARGHDIAIDAVSGCAVAFARRPGFFAVAFDLAGRTEPNVFAPEPDRHFFGHGAFADSGRLLLTSEHNIETGDGLIGVYDVAAGYRRIGEFPSHGVGPHEAILLADGRTLAVANGGIATDPTTGRENIDVAGMVPSLAFVDIKTGDIRAQHMLPGDINLLSIRHIAANAKGEVWFGGQWQGGLETSPELIGRASIDKPIRVFEPAEPMGTALKGYIGSVAMSRDGRILAASAPRAGHVVYIDTETGALRSETALVDGCGVAPLDDDVFALSSGLGALQIERPGETPLEVATVPGTEFDNHLRLIG